MQAVILKGIGGFYYAMDEDGRVHQVRAQRKIRRERLKPKVGDRVEISPGEGEEDGWIHQILPRRNELVRPPVANIDDVVVVASAAAPVPDLMMVDRLLINALYGLELETGDLSQKIDRGRNTTRSCELIPVPGGGMVLDTPGFSLLETEVFDPVEIKDSYPEFVPFEGQCYFQPCYHASEPRCAVRDAVEAGEIDEERHARYKSVLEDMRQRWRDRYD